MIFINQVRITKDMPVVYMHTSSLHNGIKVFVYRSSIIYFHATLANILT